jgi:hypothetical protein
MLNYWRVWADNVEMILREVCSEDGEWMELAQDCVHQSAVVPTLKHWVLLLER